MHHVGTLMAVALSQGGSGFPFFAPCILEYLKGTSIQDIKVTIEAVADWETRDLLMKVDVYIHTHNYLHAGVQKHDIV